LDVAVLNALGKSTFPKSNLRKWNKVVDRIRKPTGEVTIGVVGKYLELNDAYKSLFEALTHGGVSNNVKVKIKNIDTDKLEKNKNKTLFNGVNGLLVPGGFGKRGSEGKIFASKYARENKIPYFGICFGMQMAVIEAARNLAGIKKASSSEFGPTEYPVVGLIKEWTKIDGSIEHRNTRDNYGGTMRLGSYKCHIRPDSHVAEIYGCKKISERHRHRYEVNTNYVKTLERKGLIFSGFSPDGYLPEIVEYTNHPWFIGVQFHPEMQSRPTQPHPLFVSYIKSILKNLQRLKTSKDR
jgi:CTP synthase